jgi:hypothetical protein
LLQSVGETTDVAGQYPEVVKQMTQIIKTATTPSEHYRIGNLYTGQAIWKR